MREIACEISEELLQDVINLHNGLFRPLHGFMNATDYASVVQNNTLADGTVWTIPISFDVSYADFIKAVDADRMKILFNHQFVGYIVIEDCYEVDLKQDVNFIFGVLDKNHPGVKKELMRNIYRIGGKVTVENPYFLQDSYPADWYAEEFSKMKWESVCGFQTRNPIHRAHEHLHRTALEVCDGLFINPLIGWKKKGDFSKESVIGAYEIMLNHFYPKEKVFFAPLRTQMRYAGPKEAMFHAQIRKNMGCSHFIVGRDHAGVGDYYGMYEAQDFIKSLMIKHDLGIEFLLLKEPFYCKKCSLYCSEKSCGHSNNDRIRVSGSEIRAKLSAGKPVEDIFMRPEISKFILSLGKNIFIQ